MKKIAVVTGGARGIGFAIAIRLAGEGFNLAIVGTRDSTECGENLARLSAAGAEWFYIKADTSRSENRSRIIRETVEKFGRIDLLVNNAGVAPRFRSDLLEMSEESFDYVLGVNTKANMFLTQLAAKQMLVQPLQGKKRGTIINISSCSAEVSSVNRGEYCVSKAGIAMLTKLYADRLAADGIYVHEIRPGVIKTDMTSAVTEKYTKLIAGGTFPIARWGTPEDVAGAVAAFAGDTFLYTTGNYVDVDGGFHIRRL